VQPSFLFWKQIEMMDWGLYAFGIWTGFTIACAYYELRWWYSQQTDDPGEIATTKDLA
jgi:hypothetical protein